MKAYAANQFPAPARFLEQQFFDQAETLWEQLEHSFGSNGENSSGPLSRVSSEDAYSFLLATADRVFSHDLALEFLSRMRSWGKEKLGTRHASTPQVHIYTAACRRELAPDATPARWHYLYSLSPKRAAVLRLASNKVVRKKWLALVRVDNLQLSFNQLLVHETREVYGLHSSEPAAKPLEGAILLHGYLW